MDRKRMFLSSTCYDLAEVRDAVERWAETKGYSPMLSDRANFPVDINMHRHDVCLANAKTADLFILLVAGRFGAPYYADSNISITWAEYRAASESGVPMAVFVDERVWNERQRHRAHPEEKLEFTKNSKIFAFLSEIQDSSHGYWMEIYDDIAAILERLDCLAELFPVSLHRKGGIVRDGETIVTASLSAETQHHVRLAVGDLPYLNEEHILQALVAIPRSTQQHDGQVDWTFSSLHGFSVLIERVGNETDPMYLVRPTSMGEAIRDELDFAFALL